MGGPSRESSRAAAEAARKRRAALRTRDGIVDLAELRQAGPAVEFLRGLYGRLPSLLGVRILVAADVGFELEVTLSTDDRQARVCLPSSVNDIPVRVVVRNARATDGQPAAPAPSDPSGGER